MNSDLYILSTNPDEIILKRLTYSTDPDTIHYGLADFLAQQEMDRYCGYWWDPNSNGIAFVKVDESNIPVYRIMYQTDTNLNAQCTHQNKNDNYEDHRYPFAGKENLKITLGHINLKSTNN